MPTLDEVSLDQQIEGEQAPAVEVPQAEERGGISLDFLRAETGEGSIEDYIDHPLNFSHSKAIAQIIRGVTGLFGNLRLAVIDILFGILQYVKERKVSA